MARLGKQPRWALRACLLVVLLVGAGAEVCEWSRTVEGKTYSFNLGAPLQLHPHGVRSEDGYYKVTERVPGSEDEEESTFWFQLCEPMKFNSAPPPCQLCPQSCGGGEKCGETCSALQAVSKNGYSKCVTLASSGHANFSLMDETNPARGVSLSLSMGDADGCPQGALSALKVHVACATNGVVEVPTFVREEPKGSCQYVTIMEHPSGCPVVTFTGGGGVGWLGLGIILILCGAIVYFVVGLAYRTLALGVSGIEAIPNLEFWRSFPSHVQEGWSYIWDKVGALHRAWTDTSYNRVT